MFIRRFIVLLIPAFYTSFLLMLIFKPGNISADATIAYRGDIVQNRYHRLPQNDIRHPAFMVFNKESQWNNFIENTPSFVSPIPVYDEATETVIVYIAKTNVCVSMPDLSFVLHQYWFTVQPNLENIEVNMVHRPELADTSVDCSPDDTYIANIVFIDKTLLPISLDDGGAIQGAYY